MINLHNHSTWSDGLHSPEMIAKMGILSGLTHVGISDHFYTEKLSQVPAFVDVDNIVAYTAEIRRIALRFVDRIQVHAEVVEHGRGHTLTLPDQPEKDVLGAHVVVLQADGLFPGHGQDFPNAVSEVVIHVTSGTSASHRAAGPATVIP